MALPWASPLAAPLLTEARFKSALARGDLSLVALHAAVDNRIDAEISDEITSIFSAAGIQHTRCRQSVEGLVTLRRTSLTYQQFQRRHNTHSMKGFSGDNDSENDSENAILATTFIVLSGARFLALAESNQLTSIIDALLTADATTSVHLIVSEVPSRINAGRSTLFLSLNIFVDYVTRLWLQYNGRCQCAWQCVNARAAAIELATSVRAAAHAEYKNKQEEAKFAFGSAMARKGRTAAMKGARSTKRKTNYSEDGSSSDDSNGEAVDADAASLSESWLLTLSVIRGVSEDRAAVISRAFPSLRALLSHYDQLDRSGPTGAAEAELAVADLRCGSRRIGEILSRRIYRAFGRKRVKTSSTQAANDVAD